MGSKSKELTEAPLLLPLKVLLRIKHHLKNSTSVFEKVVQLQESSIPFFKPEIKKKIHVDKGPLNPWVLKSKYEHPSSLIFFLIF